MNRDVNTITMGAPHVPRIPSNADLTNFKQLLSQGKLEQAIYLIESGLIDKQLASKEIYLWLRKKDIAEYGIKSLCIAISIMCLLLLIQSALHG